MNDHSRDQLPKRARHLFITFDCPARERRGEVIDRAEVARHCRRMQFYGLCRGHESGKLSFRGRAYLAYCPDKERQKILTLLRNSKLPEDRLARDEQRLNQILAETRARGYGTRDPSFGGGAYGQQAPDGLSGIAVPLLDGRRVHGVINIIWPKAAKTVNDMVREHLADLQGAAHEIVDVLHEQKRGR